MCVASPSEKKEKKKKESKEREEEVLNYTYHEGEIEKRNRKEEVEDASIECIVRHRCECNIGTYLHCL